MAASVVRAQEAEGGEPDGPELNLRILQSLALWLKEHVSEQELAEVAAAGGVTPADLDGRSSWVSWKRCERILEAASRHLHTEEEFRAACAYRLAETYGPLLLLLKAGSPAMVYRQAAKSLSTISTISEPRVEILGPTSARLLYRSRRPESRWMCLSRQGQAVYLPTLWGLPKARLTERRCIAWGDDACEYEIRWHASRRWLPIVGAVLGGGLLGLAASMLGLEAAHWLGALTTSSAGLLAYAYEQRRANAINLRYAEEAQTALGNLAGEEGEVRRELVALQDRQADWLRRVEQELEDRTRELMEMGDRVEGIQEKRVRVMRGQVHDLRNMLSVVLFALDLVEQDGERLSERSRSALDDARDSTSRIERILRATMQGTEPGRVLVALEPELTDVEPLSDALRRRLRAFAHGKDIRTSVFRSREAPSEIVTDRLLMDRVLDNLLGNAAKYTTSGSIVVEVGGTPGFLTIKISDTGPGISSERIARVFRPSGSLEHERVDGFGVGLSVVVQLLAQIGGRLEVMSKPGEGTTFWVHIPVALDGIEDKGHSRRGDPSENVDQIIERVLHIRAVN